MLKGDTMSIVRATYGTAVEADLLTPVLGLALRCGLVSRHIAAADLVWSSK